MASARREVFHHDRTAPNDYLDFELKSVYDHHNQFMRGFTTQYTLVKVFDYLFRTQWCHETKWYEKTEEQTHRQMRQRKVRTELLRNIRRITEYITVCGKGAIPFTRRHS